MSGFLKRLPGASRGFLKAVLVLVAVGLTGGAIFLVGLATVNLFGLPVTYPSVNATDAVATKLSVEGDIVAGATFALAILAGIVAFAAYLVAIRAPKLTLEIRWGPNEPVKKKLSVEVDSGSQTSDDPAWFQLADRSREVRFTVKNKTRNSARNPALRLRFVNVQAAAATTLGGSEWESETHPVDGHPAYVWTKNGSLYGTWQERLPIFSMVNAQLHEKGVLVKWELAAEGFARTGSVLVDCVIKSPPPGVG